MNHQEDGALEPGAVVGARYRVEKVVGRGAFAQVYRGLDVALDRLVAIKLLNPSKLLEQQGGGGEAMRAELVERFYREARTVAKLRDEHAVTLFDFGATPTGGLYMVLEFVDGRTLRDVVDEEGPLSAARVVAILRQSLSCLREAHSYGMLHRDIKPENIMLFKFLEDEERVRLVDFGIAKALETDEGSDLTAAGVLIGTPKYVAPERIHKQELGPASDIYSLGVVAYELLVGRDPFHGLKGIDVLRAQLSPESLKLPPDVLAKVPEPLANIVHTMLEKELSKRYRDAQQVLEDLIRIDSLLTIQQQQLSQPHEFAKTSKMMAIDTMSLHQAHQQQRVVGPSDDPTMMSSISGLTPPKTPTSPTLTPSAPEPRPSGSHYTVAEQLQRAELAAREKQARTMMMLGIAALIGGGLLGAIGIIMMILS
jgi:serine/threonine protein kinase